MNRISFVPTAIALTMASMSANAGESLYFVVPNAGAAYAKTIAPVGILGELRREDMGLVRPDLAAPYSAHTFLSHQNWNTLLGDRNCDGIVFQSNLTGGIDAVDLWDPGNGKNTNVFISIANDLPATATLPAILDGDIFSPRASGTVQFLITETQIKSAFGIAAGAALDVDAFAHDPLGTMYFSFDAPVAIVGGVVVQDGAILAIPAPALAYAGSSVAAVIPNSGILLLDELAVDALVVHSTVHDNAGAAVTAIGDVEGLDVIRSGPTHPVFTVMFGNVDMFDLRLTGENLTGSAVVSTESGGVLATMNGAPLASPILTNGSQMGLVATGSVKHLLDIASVDNDKPTRFTLDTDDAVLAFAPSLTMEWDGADPLASVVIGVRIALPSLCAAPASTLVTNPCHQFIFAPTSYLPAVASDALGHGSVVIALPGIVPPGLELVFQAYTPKGIYGVAGASGAITTTW